MSDIALAAFSVFSVFFTQSPSFLSFQRNMEQSRVRNNARSLFQVQAIPTDNHIRQTLDSVASEPLMVPLRSEFIVPQDGHAKQECEIAAAKRWLAAHAARDHTGNDTLLGDDLYAHQPFCRQVLLHGFHFLFMCKPASHPHLTQWVEALVPGRDRHALTLRTKGKSNLWERHVYRWAHAVPLTDSDDALPVNWCDVTVTNDTGKILYHNAWITDRELTADTVAGLVSAGRARWKIENENNNVLKTKGYHLEHNFGHGKEYLSSLLVTLNLLAFALHTFLELADGDYRLIRTTVGARRTFFEHLRALTTYPHFENWTRRMDFMMRGLGIGPHAHAFPQPRPAECELLGQVRPFVHAPHVPPAERGRGHRSVTAPTLDRTSQRDAICSKMRHFFQFPDTLPPKYLAHRIEWPNLAIE